MLTPQLESQFLNLCQNFLDFTLHSPTAEELESENVSLFFQSDPVKNLISFGAEHNEALDSIVSSFSDIHKMDIYYGCLTGYLIGLYGESEIACEETDTALCEFFLKAIHLCETYIQEICSSLGITKKFLLEEAENPQELFEQVDFHSIYPNNPDLCKVWAGMEMLSLGLMSRASSSRSIRDQLRKASIFNLCEELSGCCGSIGFVPYLLNMAEEETAILIAPERHCGVEVRMEQMDSNNVFFTLFQFALYHKGLLDQFGAASFSYNEVIERIAKHEFVSEEEWPKQVYESGCFGYHTYPALQADGSYDPMLPVWGEGTIYEVPKLENRFLILLTKPFIRRTWGNAFVCSTHSRLRPKVEILRELPPEEVTTWLQKVKKANRIP